MIAIREIVNRDIFTGYDVPKEFGNEFEMILVPTTNNINKTEIPLEETALLMKHQEENGFSRNVLAQECEDVWNDI